MCKYLKLKKEKGVRVLEVHEFLQPNETVFVTLQKVIVHSCPKIIYFKYGKKIKSISKKEIDYIFIDAKTFKGWFALKDEFYFSL